MEQLKILIEHLKKCIPALDTGPLYASLPEKVEQEIVLRWLYENLSNQNMMVYEEWTEYSGYLPDLKPLDNIALSIDPAGYIFTLINNIDWSTSSIEPWDLPYVLPWFEHINYYIKADGLRLVDLLPFENAYIMCLLDDEELIEELHQCMEDLEMGINTRPAMDQQQIVDYINSVVSE